MAHVFVSPHPDDVALSCGGLIASLRELGHNVTILTVFSGNGGGGELSPYQREALGFGTKALWPLSQAFNRSNLTNDYAVAPPTETTLAPWEADPDRLEATQEEADQSAKRFWQRASWYRRANIAAEPLAGQPLVDEVPQQGATLTTALVEAEAAGDTMATRRLEDERFAYFSEASIVFLDLPDAVFRGYEGDHQLLGAPRADDEAPLDLVVREIARLEPQKVYVPLGVGDHVDHQLMRRVGIALLNQSRRWVMPGPEYAGTVTFYEDFPYAWWQDFSHLGRLPAGALDGVPPEVSITPEYADITDVVERKINGIRLYESQMDRLFGGVKPMAHAVRAHGLKIAGLGGVDGMAERYWSSARL